MKDWHVNINLQKKAQQSKMTVSIRSVTVKYEESVKTQRA